MLLARLLSCFGIFSLKKYIDECPICLEDDHRHHFVQPCGHLVHDECFLQWCLHHPERPPRCVLCQTKVHALLINNVWFSLDTWMKKELERRFKKRFMDGGTLYLLVDEKTLRAPITPSTTVKAWKKKVMASINSFLEKKQISRLLYEAIRYFISTIRLDGLREDHCYEVNRFPVWGVGVGGPAYLMFSHAFSHAFSQCGGISMGATPQTRVQ